jgi:PAS domain S-box-containing protein
MAFSRLRSRLLALFGFWLVVLLLVVGAAVTRMQALSDTMDSVLQDRLLCQSLLRSVADVFRLRLTEAVDSRLEGRISAAEAQARITAAQGQAATDWARYLGTRLVAAEQRGIEQAAPLWPAARAAAERALQLLASDDRAGLQAWRRSEPAAALEPLAAAVDALFALQLEVADTEVGQAQAAQRRTLLLMLTLVGLGLLAGGGASWALVRHYTAAGTTQQRALQRTNAFYTALSRTNHLILRTQDEPTLLQGLCRICTETGQARMTTVYRLEGEQVLRAARAGPDDPDFVTLPDRWALDDPLFRDSRTAQALRLGRPRVGPAPWPGAAPDNQRLRRGSAAAFPLRRGGQVFGALSLYATEPDFFDEALEALLAELADDVSFALDNIDREAARQQLQAQALRDLARFQKLFRSSPMACVITSLAERRVLEINDAMCERFGVEREAFVGAPVSQLGSLLAEEDARAYRDALARDGRVQNLRARLRPPGGRESAVLINAELIDYDGRPCVLAMALDITELQAAEAAERARAAAEAANREKTAFLSRMSHELRTPLNAMIGFTQLLQRDAAARLLPPDVEQLEHIRRAGWHLVSLVNDVMDVSRIEAGHFAVESVPVALREALDEALHLGAAAAQAAGVRLDPDYLELGPVGVLADPLRLRQVLINLVSNAIKYNRPGGSVLIDAMPAGAAVVIEIADSGIGMSTQQLQHLFEPFNRLGRERGGIEGTGLGLALTRQLVGLMGGELQIESRPGVGTTARVTLPAAALSEHAPHATAPAPRAAQAETAAPQGTVLYIEDNEVNVMLIEQMLSRWPGVRFVHAGSGAAGIELASRLRPELVLLDMHLPDLHGLEILARLRADEGNAGLPVVMLSASAAPDDLALARAQGATDYWTKPVDLHNFLRDTARLLAPRALAEGAA